MANAVISLDIGVLLRLSGLDVSQGDALALGPFHEGAADIFRAVVAPDRRGRATPFDNLVQRSVYPFSRQREVDLDAKALAVEVVQNVQKAKLTPISKAIRHEVHGPDLICRLRNR